MDYRNAAVNKSLGAAARSDAPSDCGEQCKAERMPVAAELVSRAEAVANRAQALSDRVIGKLNPIMANDFPTPACEATKDPQWPPLFEGLRNCLQSIDASLDSIRHALDRTEL